MVEFNASNYPTIKQACDSREEIEFIIDKSATAFSESEAPDEWTAYPPACLPPEGYAQVFVHSGNDKRGALTRLELVVHLDGGRILYKKRGEAQVSLKITWPNVA
jgi:hypothetical protein